jgi:quercetin dioxygenase-like cupin family protein
MSPAQLSPAQFQINVLLRSEETQDALAVIENTVPAGFGGPELHHHDFDETFYVLEGELTCQLGEELSTATAGTLAFARRGVNHAYANLSGAPARFLLICTPAGFERHFDRLAAQTGVAPPPQRPSPTPNRSWSAPGSVSNRRPLARSLDRVAEQQRPAQGESRPYRSAGQSASV